MLNVSHKITCPICKEVRETRGFHKHLKMHTKPIISRKEYRENLAKRRGYDNYSDYRRCVLNESMPMEKDKSCSNYLGIVISETKYAQEILQEIYKYVVHMPNNNIGYDYRCSNDNINWDKIDVKSGCLMDSHGFSERIWKFYIRYNKIPNNFLFLGFDNRESLNLLHIWMIKSKEVIRGNFLHRRYGLAITKESNSLSHFSKYECKCKLDKLKECCNNK